MNRRFAAVRDPIQATGELKRRKVINEATPNEETQAAEQAADSVAVSKQKVV